MQDRTIELIAAMEFEQCHGFVLADGTIIEIRPSYKPGRGFRWSVLDVTRKDLGGALDNFTTLAEALELVTDLGGFALLAKDDGDWDDEPTTRAHVTRGHDGQPVTRLGGDECDETCFEWCQSLHYDLKAIRDSDDEETA